MQNGSDFWFEILLTRGGITIAHSIITVDHLGKGSSLPYLNSQKKERYSSEKKKGFMKEIFVEREI